MFSIVELACKNPNMVWGWKETALRDVNGESLKTAYDNEKAFRGMLQFNNNKLSKYNFDLRQIQFVISRNTIKYIRQQQ